jgi:hypothetical protein
MYTSFLERSDKRVKALAASIAALAVGLALLIGSAPAAHAESQEEFCVNYHAGSVEGGSARCHDPSLRLVTQVLVDAGAHAACASALNASEVVVFGWVCAGPGEFTVQAEPDGTQSLYGAIRNNAKGENIISGREWFL